mgnify:CR=1 FL=1
MRLEKKRLVIILMVLTALVPVVIQESSAYVDQMVYDNLKKSRDALLNQQSELQKAYDDTAKQIDVLQQRLARIDAYSRQVRSALKDVDDAMSTAVR